MVSATPVSSSSVQLKSRSSSSNKKPHSNGRIKYGFTYQQLEPLFHLPLVQAAKKLDTCTATLKRACRRIGIPSWPHRQVRSAMKRALEAEQAGRIRSTKSRPLQPIPFKMETLVELLRASIESTSSASSRRPMPSTASRPNDSTFNLTNAPPLPKLPSLKHMLARNDMVTSPSSRTYTTSNWKCCGVSTCITTVDRQLHHVPVLPPRSTTAYPQVLHNPMSFCHGMTYISRPPIISYRNVVSQSFA